jgi:quercetin dioxygenase-like cupin family protein
MIPDDLEALALADAIGALDVEEQRDLHARVAQLTPEAQNEVARVYEMSLTLATAVPPVDPPAHVRERLMARIGTPTRYSVLSSEGEWTESGLPGITVKVLSVDRVRGLVTMLIRGEPGAVYPPHPHSGPEECYVIRGSVHVDGRVLKAGDFHHADADSDHGELSTPDGAEVLIVGATADYLR